MAWLHGLSGFCNTEHGAGSSAHGIRRSPHSVPRLRWIPQLTAPPLIRGVERLFFAWIKTSSHHLARSMPRVSVTVPYMQVCLLLEEVAFDPSVQLLVVLCLPAGIIAWSMP
jgi:hypothetical protein